MSAIAMQAQPIALDLELPWHTDAKQDEAFKRWLKRLLWPLLLLFIIIPWLPVFEKAYEEQETDIVRTEIILDPIVQEPEPEPVPEAPPPPPPVKPEPQPVQKEITPPKQAQPVVKQEPKRSVAEEQGLTAISSQLNSLRQTLDLTKLQKKNVSVSQGGQIARADSTVLGADKLTQKSEGIVVDENIMKAENVALVVHESTKLDGFIDAGSPDSELNNFYSELRGQRSDESIRRVFEAGKSRAYMFYLRELRDKPGLSGTFVFEVVIQPSGNISDLKLVSSELNSPQLEARILESVRQLNFGAEDVSPRRLTYKFNFLPS